MEATQILESPIAHPFYRRLATMITLLGLGDRTWWGYEAPNRFILIHRKFITTAFHMSLVLQIIYLIRNYKTLPYSTLCTLLTLCPVTWIVNVCIRSAQMDNYKKIMKLYTNKIHLFNCDDSIAGKIAIKADRYTRIAGYYLLACLIADCTLWFSAPIVHMWLNKEKIRNKTVMLQTTMHLWMPHDFIPMYNIRNWIITHIINTYIGLCATCIIVAFNTLNFTFLFHLIGHVQILKHKFRTEFSTTLSDFDTKHMLINLIKHHSFIIEIFKDTQTAFGYNVTANYCHNLISDSLLMYEIMLGEKKHTLMYGLMILVFMGGLILMSLVLEEIRRESDDLADVIYSIPWEEMSVSNQKTFMMILARAQPPLEYISAGGLRAGVRPAITIIKSTFSYYVMLKTMRAK